MMRLGFELPRLGLAVPVQPRRANRRSHSRIAVLGGLFFFVAAHLWLAVQVETRMRHWRDPEFMHRLNRLEELVRFRKANGHTGPTVVVIGGSRPQMGLSPERLARGLGSEQPLRPGDALVFDLVHTGMMTVSERLAVSRLLATNTRPDYLLLELRPSALADGGPAENYYPYVRMGWADIQHLEPYLSRPDNVKAGWFRTRANSWFTLRRPLLDNWGLSRHLPAGPQRTDFQWKDMTLYGWSPHYPVEWPEERRAAAMSVARREYKDHLSRFQVVPINDRLFRGMLNDCREHGVKAALYVMPESPLFRSWYPPGAREAFHAYSAGLSREFGVPVFNAIDWIDDETAFMDGHHLLGPAAERFSERFGRECVSPWIARAP